MQAMRCAPKGHNDSSECCHSRGIIYDHEVPDTSVTIQLRLAHWDRGSPATVPDTSVQWHRLLSGFNKHAFQTDKHPVRCIFFVHRHAPGHTKPTRREIM